MRVGTLDVTYRLSESPLRAKLIVRARWSGGIGRRSRLKISRLKSILLARLAFLRLVVGRFPRYLGLSGPKLFPTFGVPATVVGTPQYV